VSDFELTNDDGTPCFDFELRGGKVLMHGVTPRRYFNLFGLFIQTFIDLPFYSF